MKPLRAQAASIGTEVEVYKALDAEIQRLSTLETPLTATHIPIRPVNKSEPAAPQAAIAAEPEASAAPLTPDRPVNKGEAIVNSIGMKFCLIPAGTFTMGSPESEKGRDLGEVPHMVTITKDFYLGTFEVNQDQYVQIMGVNPSTFKGTEHPAGDMTWNDAMEFCSRLTKLENANGKEYRLPTEAEWEYACRAGTVTSYCSGDTESQLAEVAWYKGNSGGVNHPVGKKQPNAWGLYDMHGNVHEWCLDGFQDYPRDDATTDPVGVSSSGMRICRGGGAGGAFESPAKECRSAYRMPRSPNDPGTIIGFRVAMTTKPK